MLSEEEIRRICNGYEIACAVCGISTTHFRLKRDMCRPLETEGDGHPLSYRWRQAGFDSVDPLQFFWGVCQQCGFAGEMNDADFRTSSRDPKTYKKAFDEEALRRMATWAATGKGVVHSLKKTIKDADPLGSAIAKFHLGIFSQCLRTKIVPGPIARYYLRLAWLYRDQERFYAGSRPERFLVKLEKLKGRWKKDLPAHKDYPTEPELALCEAEALRFSRTYFERNFETLRQADANTELRLQYLLAEIAYRLYELTSDPADYKKAASYFSGIMQNCLRVISDKSIVGGVVNRSREMLEVCGERGRQLRALHQSRGGVEVDEDSPAAGKKEKGGKKAGPEPKAGPGKERKKSPAAQTGGEKKKGQSSAPGGQLNLEQATRQVAMLQEEVQSLSTQVKRLEADNKKWRQLLGRDNLTGLPNKIALFHINCPKVLRELDSSGPYSFICVGLDHVHKVNLEQGWAMGNRMLKGAIKGLRQFLEEGDELYRLEGANFALAGPMSNNAARQRAADMRRRLAKASLSLENTRLPLASSLGVLTIERHLGGSGQEAARAIYEALVEVLYRAKQKGGNRVEVCSASKF